MGRKKEEGEIDASSHFGSTSHTPTPTVGTTSPPQTDKTKYSYDNYEYLFFGGSSHQS